MINIYFLSSEEKKNIQNLITEHLKDKNPKSITKCDTLEEESLMRPKLYSATMFLELWKGYIGHYQDSKKWPIQCSDIYKYLLDDDLAQRINIDSIKEDLLEFYVNTYKLVGTLLKEDNNLQISNCKSGFLAYANYLHVINGFKKLLEFSKEMEFMVNFNTGEIEITRQSSISTIYGEGNEYKMEKKVLDNCDDANKLVKVLK